MQLDPKRVSVLLLLVITLSACFGIQTTLLSSNDLNRQEINSCTVIDKPGRYELTTNITNGGEQEFLKAVSKFGQGMSF